MWSLSDSATLRRSVGSRSVLAASSRHGYLQDSRANGVTMTDDTFEGRKQIIRHIQRKKH